MHIDWLRIGFSVFGIASSFLAILALGKEKIEMLTLIIILLAFISVLVFQPLGKYWTQIVSFLAGFVICNNIQVFFYSRRKKNGFSENENNK